MTSVTRNRLIAAAAAIVVAAAGIAIGIDLARGDGDTSASQGPLRKADGGLTMTGVTVPAKSHGYVWTAVVLARFDRLEKTTVSKLDVIPVPGFPTPKLLDSGLMTSKVFGSNNGLPRMEFPHVPLLDHPFTPEEPAAGIMVVLEAAKQPGMYAIGGIRVQYRAGGEDYEAHLYTAVTGCVPESGEHRCPQRESTKVFNTTRKLAS